VILREKLTQERLLPYPANQPASTIVIEAGCGAHHWARAFTRLGHEVRLIHAKLVRRSVKTNKNDWNDAAAICKAAQRPTMRFVATKSLEPQDLGESLSWDGLATGAMCVYVASSFKERARS
jgi:transposase